MDKRSRRRTRVPVLVAAVSALVLGGCSTTAELSADADLSTRLTPSSTSSPTTSPELSQATAPAGDAAHVVIISVDGLNPEAIGMLGAQRSPALHRLIDEGASTLNARAMLDSTSTLPNHTSMVTGRPVRGAEGHDVTQNNDFGGTVHDRAGEYVQSLFSLVHDNGGSAVFYAAKDKLNVIARSWDAVNGAPDVTGVDDGTNKIDEYVRGRDADLAAQLVARLADDPPTVAFLHLGAPDQTGHDTGWLSEGYLAAVEQSDSHVLTVMRAIEADPALAESTVLLLTSDHGGLGTSHRDPNEPANFTIPLLAWGAQVEPGADLYDLNADDRSDPGEQRAGPPAAPIHNAEVANVAADLLGLPPVPGSVHNVNHDLDLG